MTQPTPQPAAAQPGAFTEAEDKQWASFAHLGGLLGPLPALIIFLIFKDRGTLTKQESKEALNWMITWGIASVIVNILGTIIGGIVPAIAIVFTLLVVVLYVANAIFSIMGFLKVRGGGSYRYPFAVRFLK